MRTTEGRPNLMVAAAVPMLLLVTLEITLGPIKDQTQELALPIEQKTPAKHVGMDMDMVTEMVGQAEINMEEKTQITSKIKLTHSRYGSYLKMNNLQCVKELKKFTTNKELIEILSFLELEGIRPALKNKKYGFLFDVATIENKGDTAMTIGELNLLEQLDIQVVFYCGYECKDYEMKQAKKLAESYSPVETIILFHGGGNFGGYVERDYYKIKVLKYFPDFPAIMFPQSVWFHKKGHLELTQRKYSSHMDFQFFIRDLPSYDFIKTNFSHNKATLVPDSAFQMGYIGRFAPPIYDIIWITRKDKEAGNKMGSAKFPRNIKVTRTDWTRGWKSPKGVDLMEQSYLNTYNGLLFLQRGRVLITDRLHGHILAILSNIPTVIIDNKIKKLSMFRNTWTHGLERVLEAKDDEDAVDKAMFLLDKYYSY